MEEPFKLRRVNAITGTFVLLVIGLLILAGLWTGRTQRWFKGSVTLRISLPQDGAAGIRQGSEVYFLGTRVGSVFDVNADPTGHMEAEATIRRDFFRFVRTDSSAVVKKKFGVAGDSFFEITRGIGQPLPEKNASIVCNEQFQSALEAAIEEIRRETLVVLKKTSTGLETWNGLGSNLIATRERLDRLIGHTDTLATGLQQGQGTAGRLLTDSAIADQLEALLGNANKSVEGAQVILKDLQNASGNLQTASIQLPAISEAVANEARDLPGLVLQTQHSMRELERLTEALQRHWLVRKYVNKTNPPPANTALQTTAPERSAAKALLSPATTAR